MALRPRPGPPRRPARTGAATTARDKASTVATTASPNLNLRPNLRPRPSRRRTDERPAPPGRSPAMNPSRLFILRPVGTSLLMAAILLVGAVAYRFLPLSALPEVDYPTIQVQTFYPGASPEVMTSSVTAPLERQFG